MGTYIKLDPNAIKRIYKKTTILRNAKCTITFNTRITDLDEPAGDWTTVSKTAEYGDILVVTAATS